MSINYHLNSICIHETIVFLALLIGEGVSLGIQLNQLEEIQGSTVGKLVCSTLPCPVKLLHPGIGRVERPILWEIQKGCLLGPGLPCSLKGFSRFY